MTQTDQINCVNCGQIGAGKYCNACGNAYHTHRITLGHIIHEVVHLLTHFDKGLLYTIKELLLRPGFMQRDYLAGKRSKHQKPFAMFFVCGTITALSLYWINIAVGKLYNDSDLEEGHYYQHYFALTQMCLAPAYALVNWIIFSKRYNFAEYLVIILYNTSMLLLFVAVVNSLKLFFGPFETGYIEMLAVLAYNIITNINLFADRPRLGIALLTLLSSVICFALSRGAMEAFIRFFMPHS
jgi:hypothetical protein